MKKIMISIVVVVLLFVGVYFFFKNKQSKYEQIENSVQLDNIKNEYAFSEKVNRSDQEYLEKEALSFLFYMNGLIAEEEKEINLENVSNEKLVYILNLILSGGERVCYSKDYLTEQYYIYYGFEMNALPKKSEYYEIKSNKICVEEAWLNTQSDFKVKDYEEKTESITMIGYNDEKEYEITYQKKNKQFYLRKIEWIK